MKTTFPDFDAYLHNILKGPYISIEKEVAQMVLDSWDSLLCIQDLLSYGCVSGMVPNLIYYSDTHRFFDRYYYKIEEIRSEYGLVIPHGADLKNYLAWTTFEIVAGKLYHQWLKDSD